MKVRMLVEDRDTAYLFFDVSNAPEGSEEFELKLNGVCLEQSMRDDDVVWLMHDTEPTLEVVKRDTFDFESSTDVCPIPIPIMCLTKNCMNHSLF